MLRRTKAKLGAAALVVAGCAVAGVAWSANRLKHPSYSVIVHHSLGQIVKTNTGIADPKWVKADVVAEHTCPSGQYIAQMSMVTPHEGTIYTPGQKRGQRTQVSAKTVKLATVEEIERACGTKDVAVYKARVTAKADCWNDNVGFDDPGKKLSKTYEIPITINCKRTLIRATVRPTQWSHTCPKGYTIDNKGKRSVVTNRARPKTCVKNGTNYGAKACPFFYIYDEASQQYVQQGEIIRNLVGKEQEAQQSVEIPRARIHGNTLKLSIREEKDEISYVDLLQLRVGETTIAPTSAKKIGALKARDGDYYVMKRGDELELEFDLSGVPSDARIELVSAGYYDRLP